MRISGLVLVPMLFGALSSAFSSYDWSKSDAELKRLREEVCGSLGGMPGCPSSIISNFHGDKPPSRDWPSQAVYMHALLEALARPETCLNTSYSLDTVRWLNTTQSDTTLAPSFMWTWLVFQVIGISNQSIKIRT